VPKKRGRPSLANVAKVEQQLFMKKRDKKALEKEAVAVKPFKKLGSLAQKIKIASTSKDKPSLVDRLFGQKKAV
jgi:hypothetical protein